MKWDILGWAVCWVIWGIMANIAVSNAQGISNCFQTCNSFTRPTASGLYSLTTMRRVRVVHWMRNSICLRLEIYYKERETCWWIKNELNMTLQSMLFFMLLMYQSKMHNSKWHMINLYMQWMQSDITMIKCSQPNILKFKIVFSLMVWVEQARHFSTIQCCTWLLLLQELLLYFWMGAQQHTHVWKYLLIIYTSTWHITYQDNSMKPT